MTDMTINKKLSNNALKQLIDADKLDIESAHCDADQALCDLLTELGYHEVVAAYLKIEKWYA